MLSHLPLVIPNPNKNMLKHVENLFFRFIWNNKSEKIRREDITENHLDNLFASFFGQALDQMGQKCRYLAQNASFGPNLAVFGPKIQFLGAGSKNFGTLISGF